MSKKDAILNQFEKFCVAFKKAHPDIQKKGGQKLAIKEWNRLKASLVENPAAISDKMQEFRLKESQVNTKKLQFWNKFQKSVPTPKAEEPQKSEVKEKREGNEIWSKIILDYPNHFG